MTRSNKFTSVTGLLLGLICLLTPAQAFAAPQPVPVIEVARGAGLYEPTPFVSPAGNQIFTYLRQGGTPALLFTERGSQGGDFEAPITLSETGSFEPPSISFTDDGLYAIWGISSSGADGQQTYRPAGEDFAAVQPATGCRRFVDSASGPGGEIAVACQHRLATNPPETISFGTSPTLGPVTVNEDLVPPAYDQFVRADLTWGEDGTIAIVSDGRKTTVDPPPANETTRIWVSLKTPLTNYTADIAEATWPNEVDSGSPVVLSDGTVAVPLGGSAGARVMIRPPGALTGFTPSPLPGEGIWGMNRDSSQNLHAGSGNSDQREYWSQVRPPGGVFGSTFAIPLPTIAGGGDAYLTGFEVAPDGTEYALIRGDDGVYAASRSPGETFDPPVRLGDEPQGNPEATLTPEGDLVVAWAHLNGVNDYSVLFGGLDKTPPAVTVNSFPEQATDGSTVNFSASAADAFGIDTAEWNFGGTKVTGSDATHTFQSPGRYQVSFTATDTAGQQTVVRKTVVVPVGPNSKPVMKLKAPKKLRFRALKKRGLRIVVTAQPAVRVRATLGVSKRNATRRPLGVKVIRNTRNRHVVRIKPRRARLGKPRKFRLFVRVTGTTAIGKKTTRFRVVRIRR